ncbi:MAG TPA: coproporphyrinogen III oxidase, partial [Candidatus Krumholzibacteria bacterium]
DEELRQYLWTARRLERAGYVRYEVSNFARPGHECRHNLRYWRNESYAGFGAGAVSYLGGERCANERGLDRYAESVRASGRAVVSTERLDPPARAAETVALGLRTTEGVDLAEVAERTGWDAVSAFRPIASRLVARGWLRPGPRLTLTRMGWRFADTVAATFL